MTTLEKQLSDAFGILEGLDDKPIVLRLGTRRSELAMTQSQWVADRLIEALAVACPHRGFKVELVEVVTKGDVTQAAYLGPYLWKMTCEKANSFDVDKLAVASTDIEFNEAPEGYVKVHKNHHLWSKTRVARAMPDGQFEVVYESPELIEPDPFPKGYQ